MHPSVERRPDHSAGGFEEGAAVDLRAVWGSIVKHRWLIVAITATVTVLTAFYSLRLPKVYEAVATLEFDPSPARPLGNKVDDVSSPAESYYMTKQWLETQQKIIASRQVAESVIRDLGLHRDPEFFGIPPDGRSRWNGVPPERAASLLVSRISVVPVEGTRLVRVHVTDASPERAALLANAVTEAYIGKIQRDRLGSTLSALDWLSTQLDKLTGQLNDAELALHDFKKDHNVLSVSLEDRLNVVASDMQLLSSSLTQARMRRIELDARLKALEGLLSADPLAINTVLSGTSSTLGQLKDNYRHAMAERAELATKYGAAHPRMAALDSKLTTLREQIDEEVKGLMEGAASALREARSIEAGLSAALEQTNDAALELNLREIEYNRLHRERENQAKLQALLLERTAETNLTRMLHVDTVRVLDSALTPNLAIKPSVRQNVAFGSIAGLLLGTLIAVMLGFLDRTVKHEGDVEALGLAFLGILPTVAPAGDTKKSALRRRPRGAVADSPLHPELIAFRQPMSVAAECVRSIRTNLTFMAADRPARSIVVTSSSPEEGKTLVAANIATVIAQTGRRVLLVDTDLRRPRLHKVFGCPSHVGITSHLVGNAPLESVVQDTVVPNLTILPCGPIPPNPSELLHTAAFRQLIANATDLYDAVVFDSPPLGAVADAAVIGHEVDGVVLVARIRKTHKEMLRAMSRQLGAVGAKVLGTVLNAVDLSRKEYGYRYQYYYQRGAYYGEDERGKPTDDRGVEAA